MQLICTYLPIITFGMSLISSSRRLEALVLANALFAVSLPAQHSSLLAPATPPANFLTGENVSLGSWLFPHFHFNAVYGRTTSRADHDAAAGHHDPVTNGWTAPGFETGFSARLGSHVEAFATYHGYWDSEDPHHYDGDLEEWFAKLTQLPGGLELRGGRYFNRFGFHNSLHRHGWDWVDNYLASGRFIGEDSLITLGGELSWTLPLSWPSVVSLSIGRTEVEWHGEEHGHSHHPHAERPGFGDGRTLVALNWTNAFNYNDFHQYRFGVSGAWGDTANGLPLQLYGVHFQYEWRAHGLEPGGAYLRWRTEAYYRRLRSVSHHHQREETASSVETSHKHPHGHSHEESAHELASDAGTITSEADPHETDLVAGGARHRLDDFGIYTSLHFGQPLGRSLLEASLRYEYLSRVAEVDLPERHRTSAGLTWYANTHRTFFVRAQYNHDWHDEGQEDSVWLGVGVNWGGAEVR